MRGFSWVIPGRLAAMPRPGRGGHGLAAIDADLAFLAERGIALLCSLTLDPIPAERVIAHGMEPLHIPVPDFAAPTGEQLGEFLAAAQSSTARGRAVGVHCTAGKGRSGTFAAAYLVAQGTAPEDAITEVRRRRPGSIESAAQERAVFDLAASLGLTP